MMKRLSLCMSAFAVLLAAALPATAANVYVSRFWHNHQPIYWPDWADGHVQYAKDSIERKGTQGGHPDNNLEDIFGNHDRVQAYQYGPKDSLGGCAPGAGYAISYSGSLIDNVRSLGNAYMLGYSPDCFGAISDVRAHWDNGKNRMDMVGFCYHHALGPVLPKAVFRKEVQMLKQSGWKAWGGSESDHSKGFFPTEMAFSEEMIDVLTEPELDYQWVIVASHHLSRTCPTYLNNGTANDNYGIFSSEPNRADMNGPSPTEGWWYDSPNPGNCAWNVAPFAYQLHKIQYVNPETGAIKQMVAVPSDDVISYKAGYSGATMQYADHIAFGATDDNPVIVLPATDGDNAWGGGDSSWKESWPGFTHQAAQRNWANTSIQDFVQAHGDNATLAHVEDGAWIFPEMCYGSPYFLKWVDPPTDPDHLDACYPGTKVNLEKPGFALKFWDWAPIVAAANWCETAENYLGRADPWRIAAPHEAAAEPNAAEKAWHIYLAGLDSGFNYYGGLSNDDECKPPLANKRAIELLKGNGCDQATLSANDSVPPSMFRPQRFPYNPGGYTFGWFNSTTTDNRYRKKMGSDFYVWTHVYDLSGIPEDGVVLKVRADKDGYNPLGSIQNETFAGGDEVGEWIEIPMQKRELPHTVADLNAAAANPGEINYEFEPEAVADYYFAKVTQFRGQLVDYYVEARDNKGNKTHSDIQHVYVEDDGTAPGEGGGGASASASFNPASPTDCGDITVTFNAGDGCLKDAAQVQMGCNFTGEPIEGAWPMVDMDKTSVDGVWTYTFTAQTAPFLDNSPSLAVFFTDGNGNYESRGGANWTVSIADCDAPINGVKIEPTPAVAGETVTVSYYPAGRVLDGAEAVCAHHGYNNGNWTSLPGDAMTWSSFDRAWKFTFTVPERASTLAFCFNNGNTTWDNNGGNNWTFPVTGTVVPEAWFSGVCAVTNVTDQPYAPLLIGYNPAGRDLAVASAVYVHLGVVTADGTDWTSYPMSDQGGFWTFGYTPEIGTTGLLVCFHDDGSVWDNNDSANWSFDLGENYAAVADGLAVTSPTEPTTVEEPKATITGTAGPDIVGPITWTNATAGVGGTFEATSLWSREFPLANGSNEIVFTAQSLSGSEGYASDKAANYEPDEDFTGLNKGVGFQPWVTEIPTGSGGGAETPDADLAFVVLSPGPTQGGTSTVKFYANNEAAALAHGTVESVFVHWGATDAGGEASWTEVPGDPMTWSEADGAWEAQIAVPADAVGLSFLFNDGGDTWLHYNDVRGGDQTDWQCEVAPAASAAQGGVWAEPEGDGFGMWENFGHATKIYRLFGRYLTTNDVFSFTFKNGNIAWYTDDTQPGTGAGVCAIDDEGNVDDTCGFRFYFNGGQEVYETPYGNTTIGWTNVPMLVTLLMDDATNFTATFEIGGEIVSSVSGAFSAPCNAFRAWSWSNKEDIPDNDYDVFVDDLLLGELVYETQTAKAVLIYGTPGEDVEVETTGIVDSHFDASTGKLSLKAKVNAPNGTRVDIYTTDDLRVGEWTKAATVTVAEGGVELNDLDISGPTLFISVGRPGGK